MKRLISLFAVLIIVGLSACEETGAPVDNPDMNDPPSISSFSVDEERGEAPLAVTFSWEIADPDSNDLSCAIDPGDGTGMLTTDSCTSSSTQAHTYTADGSYTATLKVSDGEAEASETVTVSVGADPTNPGDDPSNTDDPTDPTNTDDPTNPTDCEINDNNSFVNACPIDVPSDTEAKLEVDGDFDYFTFTTSTAGVIEVDIEPVPSDIRLYADVYDADQTRIAQFVATDIGGKVTGNVLSGIGQHYVLVGRWSGEVRSAEAYTLQVDLDTTDSNELNNSFATATAISLDNAVSGTIRSNGDLDYFSVTTDTAGVIEIDIDTVPSDIRLYVDVYNTDQQRIAQFVATDVGGKVTGNVLSDAGRHYILVGRWSGSGSSPETYSLQVGLDTTDKYELNNSFAEAAAIGLGTDIIGTIRSNGDLDYYILSTSAGTVDIKVSPVPADIRLYVDVYDTDQNRIAQFVSGGAGQTINQSTSLPESGDYYVLVARWSGAGSNSDPYTLNLTKQ